MKILPLPAADKIQDQALIGRSLKRKGQIKIGKPFGYAAPVQFSFDEVGQKPFPQEGNGFGKLFFDMFQIPPAFLFRVQGLFEFPQGGFEFPGGYGFYDIIVNLEPQGLAGIFKIVIPRDDEDLGIGQCQKQPVRQGQAVHKRHIDIGHHHVGPDPLGQFQGLKAVGAGPGKGEPQIFPGDGVPDTLPDFRLVIHQHKGIAAHGYPSTLLLKLYSGEGKEPSRDSRWKVFRASTISRRSSA